ncbi:MAG: transposase [Amaricoccus sp.]|uniref:transposase n=1 Tax=Amaricoccus sp. TaxID=1872485 RepID=UPI003315A7FB
MVALRDGDLHAQGRYTEERPHAWGGAGTGFGLHSGYHTGIRPEQWREARYLNGKLTAVHWELWFASMAYVLVTALRRIGLAGTELAAATCGSIRLKLLKIGALVTHSVRRVRVAMASSCPDAAVFRLAHARLCG